VERYMHRARPGRARVHRGGSAVVAVRAIGWAAGWAVRAVRDRPM